MGNVKTKLATALLIPFLMGLGGIHRIDPDTYANRRDFNFYGCKEVVASPDQSHLDSFVAILQAYSDDQRRIFEKNERERLEKEAKAVF